MGSSKYSSTAYRSAIEFGQKKQAEKLGLMEENIRLRQENEQLRKENKALLVDDVAYAQTSRGQLLIENARLRAALTSVKTVMRVLLTPGEHASGCGCPEAVCVLRRETWSQIESALAGTEAKNE